MTFILPKEGANLLRIIWRVETGTWSCALGVRQHVTFTVGFVLLACCLNDASRGDD